MNSQMSHVVEKQRAVGLTLRLSYVLKSPQLEPHPASSAFQQLLDCMLSDSPLSSLQCSLHSSMTVTLGAHNLRAQEETQQIIPVNKALPHPDYNPLDHTNDIMLLKVRPATLPPTLLCPLLSPPTWCLCSEWCRDSLILLF
jgi:hypothetical protein